MKRLTDRTRTGCDAMTEGTLVWFRNFFARHFATISTTTPTPPFIFFERLTVQSPVSVLRARLPRPVLTLSPPPPPPKSNITWYARLRSCASASRPAKWAGRRRKRERERRKEEIPLYVAACMTCAPGRAFTHLARRRRTYRGPSTVVLHNALKEST